MLIVDPATGAMYRLNQTDFNPTLARQEKNAGTTASAAPARTNGASASSHEKTLQIIDIQQVPEQIRKNLVQIQ